MDTVGKLETLALAAICWAIRLEEITNYEDLKKYLKEMDCGWVVERMIYLEWLKNQREKKKAQMDKVHRQLVSTKRE